MITNKIIFPVLATAKKLLSKIGRAFIKMMAAAVPKTMYGIRFPILVSVLSEMDPNSGKRNSAKILSSAITPPAKVSFILNVFLRISGITLSYICQKAQMDRKAKPTIKVLLLFNFIANFSYVVKDVSGVDTQTFYIAAFVVAGKNKD